MSKSILCLTGPAARGVRVAGPLLRDVLDALVNAVQRSVRLRAEGRSRATGPTPAWVERAAAFDVEIQAGSTQLVLDAEQLGIAAPERFAQPELFDPVDPKMTCLDVLGEALEDALSGRVDSDLYDDGLVETFEEFGHALEHGLDAIEFRNGRVHGRLDQVGVEALSQLRRNMPAPQRARVAGTLDLLRHSNRMFALILASGETLRGTVADPVDFLELGHLLGQQVIVSGVAYFRASGRVLRVEAEQVVLAGQDASVWAGTPRPLLLPLEPRALRSVQGPRSGVAAIFGAWPGDESDEDVEAALRDLS